MIVSVPKHGKKKAIGPYTIDLKKKICIVDGMEVYQAINRTTEEKVSVRVISKQGIDDDIFFKEAILREASVLPRLKHQSILNFLSVQQTINNIYFFSEAIINETLAQLVDRKSISIDEAIGLVYELAKVSFILYKNGIQDRILDLDNVLILPNNRIKLFGFGYAHGPNNSHYVAPELKQKYAQDICFEGCPKSYIWTLGVIALQLGMGKISSCPVFQNNPIRAYALFMEHGYSQIPQEQQKISEYRHLIGRCLQMESSARIDWHDLMASSIFAKCHGSNTNGSDFFVLEGPTL